MLVNVGRAILVNSASDFATLGAFLKGVIKKQGCAVSIYKHSVLLFNWNVRLKYLKVAV